MPDTNPENSEKFILKVLEFPGVDFRDKFSKQKAGGKIERAVGLNQQLPKTIIFSPSHGI